MSFGKPAEYKTAQNNLGGISNTALNTVFPQVNQAGTAALNAGTQQTAQGGENVNSGVNFLNTLFQGNQANTGMALQPNIDQIRGGSTNAMNAISTLTPRGGGRSGTLFNQAFAPQAQIQNLFNQGRMGAATALPQLGLQQQGIGLQQQGIGNNLFNTGNQALGTASGANSSMGQMALQQQQAQNSLISGIASGVLGLATLPIGGGMGANGLLGMLGGGGGKAAASGPYSGVGISGWGG